MIPKIIHHIWPGNDPFKEKFHKFRQSWMLHHPDWTFYFWRIDNLPTNISPKVLDVVKNDNYTYTVKSDILRYEILRLFGGIYTDTDMECLRPLDEFLSLEFFTGYQDAEICPSLIGTVANSDIINDIVFSSMRNLEQASYHDANNTPQKVTGPEFFTPLINRYLNNNNIKVYGQEYFYPIHFTERHNLNKETPNAYTKHYWSGMDDDGWTKKVI